MNKKSKIKLIVIIIILILSFITAAQFQETLQKPKIISPVTNDGPVNINSEIIFNGECEYNSRLILCRDNSICNLNTQVKDILSSSIISDTPKKTCSYTTTQFDVGTHDNDIATCCNEKECDTDSLLMEGWVVNQKSSSAVEEISDFVIPEQQTGEIAEVRIQPPVTNNGPVVEGSTMIFTGSCFGENTKLIICKENSICSLQESKENVICESDFSNNVQKTCSYTTTQFDVGTHNNDIATCCNNECDSSTVLIEQWTTNEFLKEPYNDQFEEKNILFEAQQAQQMFFEGCTDISNWTSACWTATGGSCTCKNSDTAANVTNNDNIDLSNSPNANLSFIWFGNNLDSGEFFRVYANSSTSDFTEVFSFVSSGTDTDVATTQKNITLEDKININAFVHVRFTCFVDANNENCNFDDVNVTKEPPPPDYEYPLFFNFQEVPSNNTAYASGTNYYFNVSINSTNSTSGLDFNSTNYTASNTTSVVFNVSILNLAAGSYTYYWWSYGNGTDKNYNTTAIREYTIAKSTGNVELYLDNSTSNKTVEAGTSTQINASRLTGEGTFTLYKDGTAIAAGTATINSTTPNTLNSINFTVKISTTQNYTADTQERWIDVKDTTVPTISNALANITNNASLNEIIKINATVTDIVGISSVTIQYDPPGTNNEYNLTATNIAGNEYGNITLVLSQSGTWVFTFFANDTSANNATSLIVKDLGGESNINVSADSNTNPVIEAVAPPSTQTITEDSYINVTFYFNVTDADGASDLNTSAARARINKTGEAVRIDNLCDALAVNTTTLRFNCTVDLWWFDGDGAWTINVSIRDNSSNYAQNLAKTFTVNPTKGMKMSPTAISWSSLNLGDTNTLSGDDPIIINNSGNVNLTVINVTGYMLHGNTVASQFINAANFSVNIADACEGNALANNTKKNVSGAVANPGNHTLNDGSTGQEQLYFCLEALAGAGDLSVQTYATLGALPWEVTVA